MLHEPSASQSDNHVPWTGPNSYQAIIEYWANQSAGTRSTDFNARLAHLAAAFSFHGVGFEPTRTGFRKAEIVHAPISTVASTPAIERALNTLTVDDGQAVVSLEDKMWSRKRALLCAGQGHRVGKAKWDKLSMVVPAELVQLLENFHRDFAIKGKGGTVYAFPSSPDGGNMLSGEQWLDILSSAFTDKRVTMSRIRSSFITWAYDTLDMTYEQKQQLALAMRHSVVRAACLPCPLPPSGLARVRPPDTLARCPPSPLPAQSF